MTEPQTGLPLGGTNPPQFDGLSRKATLVTVGIGGNDAGLVGVAEECAQLGLTDPFGTACRDHYAPGGNDTVAAKIEATRPRIDAVLQGIHQRSPKAPVAIVGYPDVLPIDGMNCYPMVPLSRDDVAYIDSLIRRINAMIEDEAAATARSSSTPTTTASATTSASCRRTAGSRDSSRPSRRSRCTRTARARRAWRGRCWGR